MTSHAGSGLLPADDEGPLRVGFIGVGTIAQAIVEGILAGPHAARCEVTLSPRSARRSAALAQRYVQVEVAADNQAVVDAADIVVIGVLPQQTETVCAELTFRPGQTVVGLTAGWPPSRLAPLVAPATEVCQLIPLPMIAHHVGPMVLFPATAAVEAMLDGCGELVVLQDEGDLPVLAAASAMMSSFFAWQRTGAEWVMGQGLSEEIANHYVTSLFQGLALEGRAAADSAAHTAEIVTEHETPGGLNESLRTRLAERGFFAETAKHLDRLLARVTGG